MKEGVKACAVVVAFHPDTAGLVELLCALGDSGADVVVVDNTPGPSAVPSTLPAGCRWVSLGDNLGIAHAQNVGIRQAIERHADVVVFFDQDSRVDVNLISALIGGLRPGEAGVVGPLCVDARRGFEYPSYRLSRWGYPRKVLCGASKRPVDVDLIISSGSAATVATFNTVGLFDESLFIDFVDLEWCLRCRARGVPITVDPRASMRHSIGEKSVAVGPLTTFVHSPVRRYYRMRNAFLLLRMTHVPKLFAAKSVLSALLHSLIQLSIVDDRREHLSMCWTGLVHGIRGVRGKRV